jgi:ribose transport system substrate-binding protein
MNAALFLRYSGCALVFAASALGLRSAVPPKIGVLLKDKSSAYWAYVEKGSADAAGKLGVQVTIRQAPTVQNVGTQSVLLKALEKEGMDALVIAPISSESLQGQVAALAGKGIKIVTIDGRFSSGVGDAFIGNDQKAMSEAAAQFFLSLVKDDEETAVFRFNNVDRPVVEREAAVLQFLHHARPALKVYADIYGSSEKDAEEAQARVLLDQHPQVRAILASATVTTLAMVKVIDERGLSGKVKLVGFGTYLPPAIARAIDQGIVAGWLAQQPKDVGYKAVEVAAALVAGKQVPPTQYADFVLVTKDNLHEPRVESLAVAPLP